MDDELPPLPEGFQLHQPEAVETKSDLPPMPEGFQAQPQQTEVEHPSGPKTGQNWRGDVAAGLRGVREAIPFARDIGAGAEYLRKNLMGEGTTFSEEKQRQAERDAALAAEHPWSYGAGEVIGAVAPALLTGGESLLASGEKAIASKLAPILGSEAEAKLLAGAGSGILGGAATGAAHGLGTGTDLEERLGHAGTEALEGGAAGLVGAGVGHLASRGARKIGEKLGKIEPPPVPMTGEQLTQWGRDSYKDPVLKEVKINTVPLKGLHDEILTAIKNENYDPSDNKKIKSLMQRLQRVNKPITVEELDKIRQSTKHAMRDWANPHNQVLGGIFRDKIEDFMENLKPEQTVRNQGMVKAKEVLDQARHYWKQGSKADKIEQAIETAKNRASTSGSGGNYDNALRQEIRKIYEQAEKKYPNYYTPDEKQAMRQIFKGGVLGNLSRGLGKLDPFHHGLIGALELPHMLMHPTTGWIGPTVGVGAHKLSRHLTESGADALRNIIAEGGDKSLVRGISPLESAIGRNIAVPASVAPIMTPEENRAGRASGGKVDKRDYPAKRLTRMEKALKRAQTALAEETKPIMQMPDHHVASVLEQAKEI
jgi:hypothetical protein